MFSNLLSHSRVRKQNVEFTCADRIFRLQRHETILRGRRTRFARANLSLHHLSSWIAGCACIAFFVLLSITVSAQPSVFHPDGDALDWERPGPAPDAPPADPVAHFIATQPLEIKIAQLMMVTLEGTSTPSGSDIAFLRNAMPGAVIVTQAHNPAVAAAYVAGLREFERSSGAPLFIGADLYQLTSATRTAPSGFLQLPTMLSITAVGDSEITRKLGRFMAEHVRGMGFNLHLGPSLLLASSLEKAAPDTLTFGSDPLFTAESGQIMCDAFQEAGILSMPMGFPGGGANRSERGPAVLTTPRPALETADGLPYLHMVRHGVSIMHTGNTLVPTLDMENRPASLSPTVMGSILRDDMNFSGIVVSGPIDGAAVKARYEPSEAAVMAVAAGADMLLWERGLLHVTRAIERIAAHVNAGHIAEERIDASLQRILTAKYAMKQPEKPVTPQQAAKLSRQKELREIGLEIEKRAITLMRNENNVLPLVNKESTPVGITGVAGVEELHELLSKEIKPLVRQRITTARHLGDIQRFEIERLTRNMRGLRTVVCILTDAIRIETQIELIRALKANAPNVVVIHLGSPMAAARLSAADAVLLAYCDPVMLTQTMEAMVEILMGRGPIAILPLPEEITLRVGDTRVFNAYEIIRVPAGRLPVSLSEQLPAGTAARYYPGEAIKRVEWHIDGKRTRNESVTHNFDAVGAYPVGLTITDISGEVHTRNFTMSVTE